MVLHKLRSLTDEGAHTDTTLGKHLCTESQPQASKFSGVEAGVTT